MTELLPHNWAVLVRKGAGANALLARWALHLRKPVPNDQYSLQSAVQDLTAGGARCLPAPTGLRRGSVLWRLRQAYEWWLPGRAVPCTPVRVGRLLDSIGGMKSLDKTGARRGTPPRGTPPHGTPPTGTPPTG